MNSERLADLQALVFEVRSSQSQQNISEAIQAYYGGAYRSAIMSVWVAVTFDLFEKIDELALYGDVQAKAYRQALEREISNGEIIQLSKREQDLLKTVCEEFQFISKEQLLQFDRLRIDRNHCAHPSYTSDGKIFQPSAELTRHYITFAISSLLKFGPVRGKSSLEAISNDIRSDIFPSTPEAAGTFLEEKYLKYSKPVLLENLFKLLLKAALLDIEEWKAYRNNSLIALRGLAMAKTKLHDEWMAEKLENFCNSLSGEQVLRVFGLICHDKRFWDWIGEHHRVQLQDYLTNSDLLQLGFNAPLVGPSANTNALSRTTPSPKLGLNSIYELFKLIRLGKLSSPLMGLFDQLDEDGKLEVISRAPFEEICDKAVTLYGNARSFRHAEKLGVKILPSIAALLTPAQIRMVFDKVLANGQINCAGGTQEILIDFISRLSERRDIRLSEALNWREMFEKLQAAYGDYDDLKEKLVSLNLYTPTPPETRAAAAASN